MAPRTRLQRGTLDPASILDAGERTVARGFEALTMRAVAAELGSAPMSLYRHFANKDALLDGLLDRVLLHLLDPPQTDDWVEDLRGFAFAHALVLVEHPWVVAALMTHREPRKAAARIDETARAILARGRIEGTDAVAAFSAILALNYGWAALGRHAGQSNYERALELVITGVRSASVR